MTWLTRSPGTRLHGCSSYPCEPDAAHREPVTLRLEAPAPAPDHDHREEVPA